MCEYCEKEKKLIETEEADYIWEKFCGYEDRFVFVDRGYLRYTTDDYSCLDHGEKIKINFCPMCGRKLGD